MLFKSGASTSSPASRTKRKKDIQTDVLFLLVCKVTRLEAGIKRVPAKAAGASPRPTVNIAAAFVVFCRAGPEGELAEGQEKLPWGMVLPFLPLRHRLRRCHLSLKGEASGATVSGPSGRPVPHQIFTNPYWIFVRSCGINLS